MGDSVTAPKVGCYFRSSFEISARIERMEMTMSVRANVAMVSMPTNSKNDKGKLVVDATNLILTDPSYHISAKAVCRLLERCETAR